MWLNLDLIYWSWWEWLFVCHKEGRNGNQSRSLGKKVKAIVTTSFSSFQCWSIRLLLYFIYTLFQSSRGIQRLHSHKSLTAQLLIKALRISFRSSSSKNRSAIGSREFLSLHFTFAFLRCSASLPLRPLPPLPCPFALPVPSSAVPSVSVSYLTSVKGTVAKSMQFSIFWHLLPGFYLGYLRGRSSPRPQKKNSLSLHYISNYIGKIIQTRRAQCPWSKYSLSKDTIWHGTWSWLKKIKYHCNISRNCISKCTRLYLSAYSLQNISGGTCPRIPLGSSWPSAFLDFSPKR